MSGKIKIVHADGSPCTDSKNCKNKFHRNAAFGGLVGMHITSVPELITRCGECGTTTNEHAPKCSHSTWHKPISQTDWDAGTPMLTHAPSPVPTAPVHVPEVKRDWAALEALKPDYTGTKPGSVIEAARRLVEYSDGRARHQIGFSHLEQELGQFFSGIRDEEVEVLRRELVARTKERDDARAGSPLGRLAEENAALAGHRLREVNALKQEVEALRKLNGDQGATITKRNAMLDNAVRAGRNLIAVIDRDGGHAQAREVFPDSCKRAEGVVSDANAKLDELKRLTAAGSPHSDYVERLKEQLRVLTEKYDALNAERLDPSARLLWDLAKMLVGK